MVDDRSEAETLPLRTRAEPLPTAESNASTEPSVEWMCALLQSSDSFYPTGSYAHSFGLEGLVQAGVIRDRETLRSFLLQAGMPGLRHVELPLAAHAWRAFAARDWPAVGELCALGSALKTPRETRNAAENIGRQRAELAARLHEAELGREFLQHSADGRWPVIAPVAAALEARCLGAPLNAMLAASYYTSVASWLSAAMKMLRLGQNAAQSLLSELLKHAPEVIAHASTVPREDIGWFNPWLDIAAARHETAESRMFIS